MKINVIALAAAAILTSACSSAPRPVVPDGSLRTAANDPERIAHYKAAVEAETERAKHQSELAQRVIALQRNVAELKAVIAMQQLRADQAATASALAAVGATDASNKPAEGVEVVNQGDRVESVDIRARSVTFRVTHPYGKSDFVASPGLQRQIVAASRVGGAVEVRGRTDGTVNSAGEAEVARVRAWRAREFLVSQGVSADRIHVSHRAVGGHVADNSTPEGRTLNRRVEIEVTDVDVPAFVATRTALQRVGGAE